MSGRFGNWKMGNCRGILGSASLGVPRHALVGRVVSAPGTDRQTGSRVADRVAGVFAGEGQLGECEHTPLGAVQKRLALVLAQEQKTKAHDWIADVGQPSNGVDPK